MPRIILLTCVWITLARQSLAATTLDATDSAADWSNLAAVLNEVPAGESGASLRFTFARDGTGGDSLRARTLPVSDLTQADVLAFWLRTDAPMKSLQVRLQNADDTYAETPVPRLCERDALEPGVWYFVVWPFRHAPDWVHGKRATFDDTDVRGMHFYLDPPQLPAPQVHVDIHQIRLLTYKELLDETLHDPVKAPRNLGKALHVLPGTTGRHMMQYYYEAIAQEQAKTWPKIGTLDEWKTRRADLHKKFMTGLGKNSFYDGPLEPKIIRETSLDGVRVQCLLYRAHPDFWATANIYIPDTGPGPWPAVVVLPGHGDVPWSHAAQERSAGFARLGFLVMFTESFACGAQGEYPEGSEYHGPQPAIGYIPLGMTLMGLEVNNHMRAVDYLLTRPDVRKDQICAAGVSGGGTHGVFLIAADERIKASAPCSIAPVYDISIYPRHACMCDMGVGILRDLDDNLIMALAAPRALMRIYPHTENPVSHDKARQVWLGQLGTEEAIEKYKLTEAEANTQLFQPCRDIYKLYDAEDRFRIAIVTGKHEYNKLMRETAAAWFDRFVLGKDGGLPTEPPFNIVATQPDGDAQSRRIFSGFATKEERPADWTTPSKFQSRRARALVKKIEQHEPDEAYLQEVAARTTATLNRRQVKLFEPEVLDRIQLPDARMEKIVLRGDLGLTVPMLLLRPNDGDGPLPLVIVANPKGMSAEVSGPLVKEILQRKNMVALFDFRGTGETYSHGESSFYLGLKDGDLWQASMKIGEPILGQWLTDLEQVRDYLSRRKDVQPERIAYCGLRQAGNVALMAGIAKLNFSALVAVEPLASYAGEKYGLPYIYNNWSGHNQNLEGYQSAAPILPDALSFADIPQMTALNRPTPLLIVRPLDTNGESLPNAFAWTRRAYQQAKAGEKLIVQDEYALERVASFLCSTP